MTGRDRLAPEAACDVEESKVARCKERKEDNNQEQNTERCSRTCQFFLTQLTVRSLHLNLVREKNRFEEKMQKKIS